MISPGGETGARSAPAHPARAPGERRAVLFQAALTTVDVDTLAPRLPRDRWPSYMLTHVYYITPRAISRMLEGTGFEVVAIEPHARRARVRYLVSKLEDYSPAPQEVARSITSRLGLSALRLPVNLGDLMTVYARKR